LFLLSFMAASPRWLLKRDLGRQGVAQLRRGRKELYLTCWRLMPPPRPPMARSTMMAMVAPEEALVMVSMVAPEEALGMVTLVAPQEALAMLVTPRVSEVLAMILKTSLFRLFTTPGMILNQFFMTLLASVY